MTLKEKNHELSQKIIVARREYRKLANAYKHLTRKHVRLAIQVMKLRSYL